HSHNSQNGRVRQLQPLPARSDRVPTEEFAKPLTLVTQRSPRSVQAFIYPITLMQRGDPIVIDNSDFLCPDLTADWPIDRTPNTGQIILQAKVGNRRYQLTRSEAMP
ncbi:MAG: hypothetical protein ACM37W_24810, partial [Actinomycetota bacterium]